MLEMRKAGGESRVKRRHGGGRESEKQERESDRRWGNNGMEQETIEKGKFKLNTKQFINKYPKVSAINHHSF